MLGEALGNEDGSRLAFLLRPTSPHAKDLIRSFNNPTVRARCITWSTSILILIGNSVKLYRLMKAH